MEETTVKVAVRIRPLLPKEILHNHQVCVRVVPNTQQVVIGKDRAFTFDFVFGQKSAQEEVYSSCIKPLIISAIEGYNATVLAYGQTGSGKTYTIGGGHIAAVSDEEKGIIPHAIHEIFQSIAEHHNTDFHVKVSYIEVYKEELRDLLELESTSKELHIREDEKGNTVIIGAKEWDVETSDETMTLLETGNAARHTGTTQMNEHSSRSHAIFTMYLNQKRPKNATSNNAEDYTINETRGCVQLISSKFHFVDLAGSERVTKTGNTGERFKESVQINSGLLALGNVISALGDSRRKSAHIPYRDAKITRLLKDSLGGNAKTVMIACISPSSSSFDESLNSLKYANRARNIRNKPIVNYDPEWDRIDEMEFEIKTLREALQHQHSSLVTRTSQVSQDLSSQDKKRIHALEDQVAQLQVESYHYKQCTDEAFQFLLEVRNTSKLTTNQQQRLKEWLDMAEELQSELPDTPGADSGVGSGGEESHHITIFQLKRELKKCQDALATDEELFSQKIAELKDLQERLQSLEQEKEECLAALTELQERYRIQVSLLLPPSYTLERMVASFRTRSQMLLEQLEEHDEVLHHTFTDDSKDEEEEKDKRKTKTEGPQRNPSSEAERLRQSQVLNIQKLKATELDVAYSKRKIGELAVNIRMKEELIKELVKTGKDAQAVNRQYYHKITQLEQEAEQAKTELAETQKQLENKELRDVAEKVKLQKDFRKKMEATKLKVESLEKKQLDTKKLVSLSAQNEKRVTQLNQNVENMKQQQQLLQRKLHEESDKKRKLESEIQRDQQRIKELELKQEQQQKILKRKTEEILHVFYIFLHYLYTSQFLSFQKIDEQRKWLDEEVENVLQQRQALADLEEDLKKREAIVDKKEALLREKSQLEIKKLRSSQALNKDILNVSTRLSSIENALSTKSILLENSTTEEKEAISEEMQMLQQERDQLLIRRHCLDEKLQLGNVLSSEEERILYRLEEGIEALDVAIEYKNESIHCRQHSLRASANNLTQSEANVMFRLSALTAAETRALLCRYFNKVISLRETEHSLQLQCAEMSMKITEQENVVHELESALERFTLEIDRRLTVQQKEHEQKIQLLLQQFKDKDGEGLADLKLYQSKVQELEKDLFFYKTTSRELKKKLREVVADAGDTVLSQGGTEALTKEQKWASRPSKIIREGTDGLPTTCKAHKNQVSWEEISEMTQTPTRLTGEPRCAFSSEEVWEVDGAQPSKARALLSKPSQVSEKASQRQGITPVRVSRRELRQMSATEVSMRRSSFSSSVHSIPPDSIEITRKSLDLKM
uniref:Kinesin family member 27 n=1 Tax=Callorhinchus milii TaxID=7868 RepID=A0A4W3J3Z5_CALMI